MNEFKVLINKDKTMVCLVKFELHYIALFYHGGNSTSSIISENSLHILKLVSQFSN